MNGELQTIGLLTIACLTMPCAASGQGGREERPAGVVLGPLAVNPTIAFSNAGLDGNVFNDTENPRSDLTATVRPALDTQVHAGPAWIVMSTQAAFVRFRRYTSQNSFYSDNTVRVELPMRRFRPFAGAAYRKSRERPNLVIDLRAHHVDRRYTVGTDIRVSARTVITMTGERQTARYGDDGAEGTLLRDALGRDVDRATVEVSHMLTPLTSFVVTVGADRTMFDAVNQRDLRSMRVTSGLSFRPLALVSGRFDVGLLRVVSPDGNTDDFNGISLGGDLRYTLFGTTQLGVTLSRSIDYALDESMAYFVQTGIVGSMRRRLGERWDVSVSAGRQSLDYRLMRPAAGGPTGQGAVPGASMFRQAGAGLSFLLTPSTRLGIDALVSQRVSSPGLPASGYRNFNLVGSVTYARR